jgi:hypothetical protein
VAIAESTHKGHQAKGMKRVGKDGSVPSPTHNGRMREETTDGHFPLRSLKKGQSPSKQTASLISQTIRISVVSVGYSVSFSPSLDIPSSPDSWLVAVCMQGAGGADTALRMIR